MKKKTAALALAVILVLSAAAGGTMAYLIDTTDNVKNIFVSGKVNATLDEAVVDSNGQATAARGTGNSYTVIPGCKAAKDPTVHIEKGSLPCYVYVCVEDTLTDGDVDYTVDATWTQVKASGTKTVYRYNGIVDARSAQQDLTVFNGVTYDYTKITEANIADQSGNINVSAYVVQAVGVTEADVQAAALAYFEVT